MENKEIIRKTQKQIRIISNQMKTQRNDRLEGRIIGMKWVLHLLMEDKTEHPSVKIDNRRWDDKAIDEGRIRS